MRGRKRAGRANLEHLRKQAKELLSELQRRDPSAQLTDAQHALARGYGFASWPKLRIHVELKASGPAQAGSPFAGRWTANLAKSQRHPANDFRSATIVFDVDGDDVRITDVVVDASGREEHHVNAIRADDQEHASDAGSGYRIRAAWRGLHVLETVARKDGQVVGSATYEVSADGQTLTISADQQLIVLDRAAAH